MTVQQMFLKGVLKVTRSYHVGSTASVRQIEAVSMLFFLIFAPVPQHAVAVKGDAAQGKHKHGTESTQTLIDTHFICLTRASDVPYQLLEF